MTDLQIIPADSPGLVDFAFALMNSESIILDHALIKSFLGYDRSTDYSADSPGLVDFAFALMNSESIILDHASRTQL